MLKKLEINENNQLILELKRSDLWDYSFVDNPNFDDEMDKINNTFELKVGQAKDLYEKLGTDNELLTEINKIYLTSINKTKENGIKLAEKPKTIVVKPNTTGPKTSKILKFKRK